MIKDVQTSVKESSGLTPARLVWIKGPATLASVGLQKALKESTRCYRSEAPPAVDPSAVVVCCPEAGLGADPGAVASEVGTVLEAAPQAAVVVLGPSLDVELARAAVRAGAHGFLHAGMPPEQVAHAVSVAAGGEVVLPRELLEGLVAAERPADLSVLRARQREIVGLVAEGLSNAQIARRLYLSVSTIKQHLRKAYKLLGVKNRTQAAASLRTGVGPRRPPCSEDRAWGATKNARHKSGLGERREVGA